MMDVAGLAGVMAMRSVPKWQSATICECLISLLKPTLTMESLS
jgi:hypothetical protein